MGRVATKLDAEQQHLLLRRCRRLFTAEERSFRMDRRSQAASALRAAVADVLPRFLGIYMDETLAEYIVILICNGKHQYQARDDLEAFLGDDSAKFVAWLWSYLSKQAVTSADNCNFEHGMDNEIENFSDKRNLLVAKAHHGDAHDVNSKISVPETYHGLHKLDSTTGRNVPLRCISSTVIISPEKLSCDQCIWENQHHKNGQNAASSRSFSERTTQILLQEHLGRNASTRWLPEAVGTDDGRVPVSLKRRRNVWDRLGKPVVEDCGLVRQAHGISVQNGVHKMPKLMVAEHEQRYHVISNAQNETDSRKFTNGYTDVNTLQGHQHARKPNRSRLVGRLSFGEGNVFHGDMCNSLQDRDVISQKSSLSLPIKSIQSQSLNEFTCDMKDSPAAISEPTCDIFKPSNCHVLASKKLPSLTMQRNSETEVLHCEQVSSPAQSKTHVHEDGNSCRNKPVKDEILDVKLKLKQMEQDVLKLRSKQAQINNVKQGSLSLGPHANSEEDADSRTIFVRNVHFAATKEALSVHFMKCGTVLKVNILTDAITGHPKGAAYITFADRESIEKAVSLSGTSFLTRVLTVMRKADAPPGFLASVQQAGRPLQPWKSPPLKKVSTPKASGYHLQWKRNQSVLEKSPASCATN
ncbi:uncharacterized protein LOC120684033 isoform X4 [Panicum virgatum]|uniref:RRM domain-containing protein n=1 Tax=Panicum virgatum TaxID=38727 RepID=A0A8T0PSU4_PANVG|nr:uncharacterized protein LOC120684033 isoform X4 [Panicum virgatum]KAG2565481.1 hypothetical protein PVAP13_7NG036700 [Panicum virgatum]